MQAKVIKTFSGKTEKQTFSKGADWSGTKARFEEINAHKQGPFLKAVETESEAKEAKVKTTTKERKIKNETK